MGISGHFRDNMTKFSLTLACLSLLIVNYGECVEDDNSSNASDQRPNRPRRMFYVCPPDFLRLGSSCYYFSTAKASWQEAHFACKDRDSNLTSPQRWEDRNLREHLNKPDVEQHERWIGGVYDWEGKSWKWGRSMKDMQYQSFSRMKKMSPDALKWHCVAMIPEMLYRWSPRNCIEEKLYICQTRLRKVRRADRNKLRERWNPNGNGHKPNEIPAPPSIEHEVYNNINPTNELSANPFSGSHIGVQDVQVNYGYETNNVTPEPVDKNPKAYHLRNPDTAFAHRPRKNKTQPRRRKPFKGYVWNKEDPEAAYIRNVNALKSGKTGLSNAQIEKHLQRLERLRKKEEMQKLRRERAKERQNRQRNKVANRDDDWLSVSENRVKSRNIVDVPKEKENAIMQDDSKTVKDPKENPRRKSSHSIENVTQKTYVINNQISELHPKTIVEVHDFSNE